MLACRIGHRFGNGFRPGCKRPFLEHAHRAVPDNRLGFGDFSFV